MVSVTLSRSPPAARSMRGPCHDTHQGTEIFSGAAPPSPSCSREELLGLPGLHLLARSQSSLGHRTMHPVPCVSLTQEITKGSAFLPPKKAPRKNRGRRFPENLSVKV